ncbi:hypothetical protein R1sor_024525 [Riccia sorocarpa]|uniref:Uncharacterized protein n=1 Tax=Riccia sorocarpa TaxID=122646 RepID=A0ABD3GT70_9MARC
MQSVGENSVLLKCAYTGECEYLETNPDSQSVEVQASYLAVRFRLSSESIYVSREIVSESSEVATRSIRAIENGTARSWRLEEGTSNVVFGRTHAQLKPLVEDDGQQTDSDVSPQRNTPEVVHLTPSPPIVRPNDSDPYPGWSGIPRDPHLLSAFDAAMTVSAACELGKLDLKTFSYKRVMELPNNYDGNTIFELPPVDAREAMRRNGFRTRMDRHGHKCPHCNSPAMCSKSCSAKMFFLPPSKGKKTSPPPEEAAHISRCAIHVGTHCHPPRSSAPRHLVQLVEDTVKEEFNKNPRVSPSIVRRRATASVVEKLKSSGLTVDMSEEEKKALFLGISSVANPDKVLNMIKSIRRSSAPMGELSEIASMQKNTMFRTVQRSLFPGQADKDSGCFVFKMPDLGPGSGVDLVNRMRVGGDLHGAWVMWDVMHRIESKWCTMGIHVYDTVQRCLSTIAICELKSEDSASMEIPWKLINSVMIENGHQPAEFHGFMADNAEAGWIAVRNVFLE